MGVLIAMMFIDLCIICDALRRFQKMKVDNKTISSKAVIAFVFVFAVQFIGHLLMEILGHNKENKTVKFSLLLVQVGFFIAFAVLSFILFTIGVSTTQNTEKTYLENGA